MRRFPTLRDARHVDKLMYTLLDRHFYKDFESQYMPKNDYLSVVNALTRHHRSERSVTRNGVWHFVGTAPPQRLPTQGWKIHVSATIDTAESILERTVEIALENNVSFKFALDKNVLCMMNFKRWPRGGSGKFITLYPLTTEIFIDLIEKLYAALRNQVGPYILSDRRYKDCRVLYYRYGDIAISSTLEVIGTSTSYLIGPDGRSVVDTRNPYFSPPDWAPDPFPTSEEEASERPLNGRYRVKEALAFSNSGGVYLADDLRTGDAVVIKEARAHTCFDDQGNDAVSLLHREYESFVNLQDTGVCPRPIEIFQEWENWYLAEEYIESMDLRMLILTRSPLLLVSPTQQDSNSYYDLFVKIAIGILDAVHIAHERGLVLGDISPTNMRIDPFTYRVRLVDFEVAHVPGNHRPPYMFTLGFKSQESIRKRVHTIEDDRYAVGALLLYMMFPIAALSAIREDCVETLGPLMAREMGWGDTPVGEVIAGLSTGKYTCAAASKRLDTQVSICSPHYADDIAEGFCKRFSEQLAEFVLAQACTTESKALFPTDPFSHVTNSMSLAFGTCGILYALQKSRIAIPDAIQNSLEARLDGAAATPLPPGLMTGRSGIAWCLAELGLMERAERQMQAANESSLVTSHHSYYYGMAGIGMANLYFYVRTGQPRYLTSALSLAELLFQTARQEDGRLFWMSEEQVPIGLGYGSSGVALFLLRLYQVTGQEEFLAKGTRALEFDLSHGINSEDRVVSYPERVSDTTVEPYLETGSAGILKVSMRYGLDDERLRGSIQDVHRKYCVFPSLFFGLAGCVDVLVDAFVLKVDPRYLEMARRPIAGIRDLFALSLPQGAAVPGEGLFRISCDYATGAAGVLRALSRVENLDAADFMLDELGVLSAAPGAELRKSA
jgi:hypothetical protein